MPVVEVILPAVRRAVATARNGRIGVIGTEATIASGAYQDAFAAARDAEITVLACPRFVDFVERGVTSGRQVLGLAEGYLEPLQRAEVDTLVLGCTHYPMLSGLIQLAMGDAVTLVSSAEETAKDLLRVLTELDLLRPHPELPAASGPVGGSRPPAILRRLSPLRRGSWVRLLPASTGPPSHRRSADLPRTKALMFSSSGRWAWHSSERANYRAGLLRERRRPGFAGIGYLLRADDTPPLVIDFGGGVLGALQRHADPGSVQVLLSHLHADHCLDVPGLFVWRRYHPSPPRQSPAVRPETPGLGLAPRHRRTAARSTIVPIFSTCTTGSTVRP